MSITTRSAFYYGHTIDDFNFRIDFDEGGSPLVAELNLGSYTLSEYVTEIARALNDAGALTYSASVDRATRLITISASGTFSLLVSTGGSAGTSTFTLAGFTGADLTGQSSYTGDSVSGSSYLPQFLLQQYVSFDDLQQAASASVNQSGSGITEVVSFGNNEFMECNITFITNINQGTGNPIETNLSGVVDARSFLQDITTKSRIEFMEDRDSPATYSKCILEATPFSREGVGYRLNELYGRGLPNYYETGRMRFRKVT